MKGVGFRKPLADWILSKPEGLDCLEITAEHFFDSNGEWLARLSRDYHLFVHGLGLSLGTPGPLDEVILSKFAKVCEQAKPDWISEHIAFTRTHEADLGHLNPVVPTREAARIIADHAIEVSQRCAKPIILENITSHIQLAGELHETEFLNLVCEKAGCGLLLDVTNLFINSRNHEFEPMDWLHRMDPQRITQLHIVGYSMEGGRYSDGHAADIQQELIDLASAVVDYAPVKAIILERDEDFPGPARMQSELAKLGGILKSHGNLNGSRQAAA